MSVTEVIQNKRALQAAQYSRYRGVTFNKRSGKWKAQKKLHGVTINLGPYMTEVEAKEAYDRFVAT